LIRPGEAYKNPVVPSKCLMKRLLTYSVSMIFIF
jgi:hypothetical protein